MVAQRRKKHGFNFIDRLVLRYLELRRMKYSPKSNRFPYLERKAVTPEEKEAVHRLIMPWLFKNMNYRGVIRDTDVLELRRLALNPMVQLCIGTRQEEVKKTPWAIIESDQRDKKYLKNTPVHKRDKQFLRMKTKAVENDLNLGGMADEAAMLLSNPNSQGQTFEHLVGMLIADHAEAGDAVWVLSFPESDFVYTDDEGIEKVKLKKGARPVEIECRDILQFNKDMDPFGQLLGYWFVPNTTGGSGFASSQVYVTKDEVVWFPNDPRSNRYYGYGDVEKARDIIDVLVLSMEQEAQYFGEGMVSPGALSLDSENTSQADIEQIIDYYAENIKGHPEKMWILNRKAQWVPFSYNYRELQYLERKLWDSKMIASVFKLNTSILGISPDLTNRATMYQEKVIAYEKGIAPKLKMIEYYINTQLIWKYFSEDLSFVWDPIADMETLEKIGTIMTTAYDRGLATRNEARKEMGWDEVDGGDEFKEQPSNDGGMFGGSYDPRQAIPNGGSNWNKSKKKERISISDPSEAPEGATVERGPRGGLYYESEGIGGGAEDGGAEGVESDTRSEAERRKEETTKMNAFVNDLKKNNPKATELLNSVDRYTRSDYQDMNAMLRGEQPQNLTPSDLFPLIMATSEFLKEAPKYEGTVYRGMNWNMDNSNMEQFQQFLSAFQEGKEAQLISFTSTTPNEKEATDFMTGASTGDAESYKDNPKILFEIQSKSGVYLDGTSNIKSEEEVLFDHHSRFKVSKVEEQGTNQYRIVLTEV